jgi:perosamine synthetase
MTESIPARIPITKPSITQLEISYVNDAITTGWGEKCYDYIHKFEHEFASYIGCRHALATSSCTGAIHLALLALGVKAGDEVIVPDITWIASIEPILYIGAKPIFVDVLPDTWCIDPLKIETAITAKTKAIIVVSIYGNIAEMASILNIASKHSLKVLEDAAEGLGSMYGNKMLGSIGDIGVFSFHGTKTISTGEGGVLVTNDSSIYEEVRILNDHGRNPKEGKTFWMSRYGYKYKMSNLQAAMGCAQIERANELVEKKVQIFKKYKELFSETKDIRMNPENSGTKNSYWMPTVVFGSSYKFRREQLFERLKSRNIDSRPFFYPLSSLPMFHVIDNPVSYSIYQNGINLPSFHDIKESDQIHVAETIKSFLLETSVK